MRRELWCLEPIADELHRILQYIAKFGISSMPQTGTSTTVEFFDQNEFASIAENLNQLVDAPIPFGSAQLCCFHAEKIRFWAVDDRPKNK